MVKNCCLECHLKVVFSRHSEEWIHNRQKLQELNKHHPMAKINAVSTGLHSRSSSSDKAGCLVRTLYLARGAKVILTTNLNVQYGLFNGSMGTVVHIIYTDGNSPKDSFPTVCMIEFQRYTGPSFLQSPQSCSHCACRKKDLIVIAFTVKESKYN